MSRPRAHKLRRHARGQAIQRLRCVDGALHTVYLGEWGEGAQPDPVVLQRQHELLARWELGGFRWPISGWENARAGAFTSAPARVDDDGSQATIADLVAAYLEWARVRYVKSGKPTNSWHFSRRACQLLLDQAGPWPATAYRARHLEEFHAFVQRDGLARGRSMTRRTIALYGRVVRQVYRHGVNMELIEPDAWQRLIAASQPQRGRALAQGLPAPPEHTQRPLLRSGDIEAMLEQLHPNVRAMATLQLLAGLRPMELHAMRPEQVRPMPQRPQCFIYRPSGDSWKLDHLNDAPPIYLLERPAAVLRPWLQRAVEMRRQFVFSPKDAAQRKARAGGRYSADSYRRAIHRACDRAGVPRFGPGRLRHWAATEIVSLSGEQGGGVRAGQLLLRHQRASTTALYVDQDEGARVAAFEALQRTASAAFG